MRKLAFAVALLICTSAFAQKAPTSVRLIVPFPPGGPVDFVGRVLADGLRSQMGTAVIVDNRPGANGAVGVVALKQAPADGATLFVASSGMVTFSPHYEKSLPYDVARDLVPIVNAAYSDVGFIAANKVRAKDLRAPSRSPSALRGRATSRTRTWSSSRTWQQSSSFTFLTRAHLRPCRTSWAAISTACSLRCPPHCRQHRPAS